MLEPKVFPDTPFTLYLVTDSSLVPEGRTILEQIEGALRSSAVSVVQLREKELDTGAFIKLAFAVKALCQKYNNVRFFINDRVDVALAVEADGVHIGQDDMPLLQARQLLGPNKFIGVSCNSVEEAEIAIRDGADYLGVGPVWFTSTKKNINEPMGVGGLQEILKAVNNAIPTVAIGGINADNLDYLASESNNVDYKLNGVAVVSAIMAAEDPSYAARHLSDLLYRGMYNSVGPTLGSSAFQALEWATRAARDMDQLRPIIHHITNNVVINDNANATLALGASPIMSTNREEVEDLAKINKALVLNMGTLSDVDFMISAAQANARLSRPVILDPVGCGATAFRKNAVQRFLKECKFAVVKGNAGEILSLVGRGQSHGVDSFGFEKEDEMINAVKSLAKEYGCIFCITGPVDYISDGDVVFTIENGHRYLPIITGSGCMVTSVVACYCACVNVGDSIIYETLDDDTSTDKRGNYLYATVAAVLTVTIASELAVARDYVNGPGTFRSALIDELHNIAVHPELLQKHAKLKIIH